MTRYVWGRLGEQTGLHMIYSARDRFETSGLCPQECKSPSYLFAPLCDAFLHHFFSRIQYETSWNLDVLLPTSAKFFEIIAKAFLIVCVGASLNVKLLHGSGASLSHTDWSRLGSMEKVLFNMYNLVKHGETNSQLLGHVFSHALKGLFFLNCAVFEQ